MENICNHILNCCLRGAEWSAELLDRAIAEDEGRALLSVVVERLGDLFEPRLCEVYERLFRERAFQDAATARQQAARGTFDPAYLNYTLGKLMIRRLRGDWTAVPFTTQDFRKT